MPSLILMVRKERQHPRMFPGDIFGDPQRKYPDKFTAGQLRTLQRRVKSWRLEQANGFDIQEETEPKTELEDMQ